MNLVSLKHVLVTVYDKLVIQKQREIGFWVLYPFMITFVVARIFVFYFPEFPFIINSFHSQDLYIHHFVAGFLLVAVAGFVSLLNWHHSHPRAVASTYGIGLALALDEFSLWIHLNENYWTSLSYDAVIIVGSLLFSFVYFHVFWEVLFLSIYNRIKKDPQPAAEDL